MKTCPECRKRIDVAATKCPYCQTKFDILQMRAGSREHSRTLWGTLLGVLLAIALLVIWAGQPGNIEKLAQWEAENKGGR